MTRIHRAWLGSGALALGLTLVFGAPAQAADQTKYLPNETVTYMTANFRQVLGSKLIPKEALAKAREALKSNEKVQKYLGVLGFDPLKDFDSITVASTSATEHEKGLIIVTGKFDMAKFKKLAEDEAKKNEDAIKIVKKGDYTVWEITPPSVPNTWSVVMVDKNTILATPDADLLTEALAKAAGKKKTELKKEVAAFLKKMSKKQSLTLMILGSSLASVPIPGSDEEGQGKQIKKILEQLDLISGGLTLADDLTLQLGITTKDEGTATLVGLFVGLGLKAAPKQIDKMAEQPGNEKLAAMKDVVKDILKATKATTKDNTVTIKLTLTKDLLQKIVKEFKKAQEKEKEDQ